MFELLRSLLSSSPLPPPSPPPPPPMRPHTIHKQLKQIKCLSTFKQINLKVADPSDAAHNCHHDAALSAGFPSLSFQYYNLSHLSRFSIIIISRLSFTSTLISILSPFPSLSAGFPSFFILSSLSWFSIILISRSSPFSSQLSGINAVFYYSTNLFITTGLSETSAKYATIGIGSVMVLMTLVSIPLMDRLVVKIIRRRDIISPIQGAEDERSTCMVWAACSSSPSSSPSPSLSRSSSSTSHPSIVLFRVK